MSADIPPELGWILVCNRVHGYAPIESQDALRVMSRFIVHLSLHQR